MSFDYLSSFHLQGEALPDRLRRLLMPVGMSPEERVEVTGLETPDPDHPHDEHLHMLMAVVSNENDQPVEVLSESLNGVVKYGIPFDERGRMKNFVPWVSGHDYIVASWGDGDFYTYHLAEKVWMILGLTARCGGNEKQRLIYDDLANSVANVAEGELSTKFDNGLKHGVSWKMSNAHLRKYLWLRDARGVRVFYYKKLLPDQPALRALMKGEQYIVLKPAQTPAWYEINIQERRGGLLLEVWASVEAVSGELCTEATSG